MYLHVLHAEPQDLVVGAGVERLLHKLRRALGLAGAAQRLAHSADDGEHVSVRPDELADRLRAPSWTVHFSRTLCDDGLLHEDRTQPLEAAHESH